MVPLVSIRTATPGLVVGGATAASVPSVEVGVAPEVAQRQHRGPRRRVGVDDGVDVGLLAGEQRKVERGEIVADPFEPEMRVHGHHAAVGPQDPEQQPDRGRAVAQQHPHRRAARQRRARQGVGDVVGGLRQRRPRVPAALELERRRVRVELEDRRDPSREGARGHRILGGVVRSIPVRSISAAPIGLPSRVYMRPCSVAAR